MKFLSRTTTDKIKSKILSPEMCEVVLDCYMTSELLYMAEVSGGVVMFRDEHGQIWKLEKVKEKE